MRRRRRRIAAICGRQNEDVKLSWREQTMICVEFMVYLLGSASELFEQFCTIKTILPLHCKLHVEGKSGSIWVSHMHTMANNKNKNAFFPSALPNIAPNMCANDRTHRGACESSPRTPHAHSHDRAQWSPLQRNVSGEHSGNHAKCARLPQTLRRCLCNSVFIQMKTLQSHGHFLRRGKRIVM